MKYCLRYLAGSTHEPHGERIRPGANPIGLSAGSANHPSRPFEVRAGAEL